MSAPPIPPSANLAQRTASMTTPAEFGESHTSSFSSQLGTFPNVVASIRMLQFLRSPSQGT